MILGIFRKIKESTSYLNNNEYFIGSFIHLRSETDVIVIGEFLVDLNNIKGQRSPAGRNWEIQLPAFHLHEAEDLQFW